MTDPVTSTFAAYMFTIIMCANGNPIDTNGKCGSLPPEQIDVEIGYAENCVPVVMDGGPSCPLIDIVRVNRNGATVAKLPASVLSTAEAKDLAHTLWKQASDDKK